MSTLGLYVIDKEWIGAAAVVATSKDHALELIKASISAEDMYWDANKLKLDDIECYNIGEVARTSGDLS